MQQQHVQPSITQSARPTFRIKPMAKHEHRVDHRIGVDGWMQQCQCNCGHTFWIPRTTGMVA